MKTALLYSGSVRLAFDSRRHRYVVRECGRTFTVPSVTRILSAVRPYSPPSSSTPRGRMALAFNAYSRSLGTFAHSWIESVLLWQKDRTVLPPPLTGVCGDAARSCCAWLKWRAANPDLTPAHAELMIYSRRYRFAGTTDALFLSGGKLVLFDWKTGAKLHGVYRLQVAAYASALQEMGAGRVTSARVVRLCRRTSAIEERTYSAQQLRQAFTRFLRLRKATA